MPKIDGEINCGLMQLANGLSQWRDKSTITCVNPIDSQQYLGTNNCVNIDGVWQFAGAYVSQDQPRFRTLGSIPVEEVRED